jgi:hypothetical protein
MNLLVQHRRIRQTNQCLYTCADETLLAVSRERLLIIQELQYHTRKAIAERNASLQAYHGFASAMSSQRHPSEKFSMSQSQEPGYETEMDEKP